MKKTITHRSKMKLKLEIEMNNAAFDNYPGEEAARILEAIAERLRAFGSYFD